MGPQDNEGEEQKHQACMQVDLVGNIGTSTSNQPAHERQQISVPFVSSPMQTNSPNDLNTINITKPSPNKPHTFISHQTNFQQHEQQKKPRLPPTPQQSIHET